jgi:hypothetical protein
MIAHAIEKSIMFVKTSRNKKKAAGSDVLHAVHATGT